jgi:hypothetical protein
MILNTFFKINKIELSKTQKTCLGRNISLCLKSKYPDSEIKKVNISENGCKMSVIDYPKEFLESPLVVRVVSRFLKKYATENVLTKKTIN